MALCNFLVDTSQTKPADPSSVMQSASKDMNTRNEYLGKPLMFRVSERKKYIGSLLEYRTFKSPNIYISTVLKTSDIGL